MSSQTNKVEWDPENYEESIAAIEAWAPEEIRFGRRGAYSTIKDSSRFNFVLDQMWCIQEDALLTCRFDAEHGLSVLLNGELWLQAIKDEERVLKSAPKVFTWALKPEQLDQLEVCEETLELILINSSIKDCNRLSTLTHRTQFADRIKFVLYPLRSVRLSASVVLKLQARFASFACMSRSPAANLL